MNFQCSYQWEDATETWNGTITSIESYGSHYEIHIVSRSSIRVLVGISSLGLIACIPDWKVGCLLSSLKDIFFNSEQLARSMDNIVDGTTVAYALRALDGVLSFEMSKVGKGL